MIESRGWFLALIENLNSTEMTEITYDVFYPGRVPWMGRCRVLSVDMEKGTACISNGIVRTIAEVNALIWCRQTPYSDKDGRSVFVSDIVEDSHDVQYVVGHHRNGKYVLTMLPSGGDMDFPIEYVKDLKVVGSVNDRWEFGWLKELISERDKLKVTFEAEEATARKQYGREESALHEFTTNAETTLKTFCDYAQTKYWKHFDRLFQTRMQVVSIGQPEIHRFTERAHGLLGSLGYDVRAQVSKDKQMFAWECVVIVNQFKRKIVGMHTVESEYREV
jgi:hypothetical protein